MGADLKKLWKAFLKRVRVPATAGILISLLVLGGLLWVRSHGWLQRLELNVYDSFLRMRMQPSSTDEVIKIVGMTEADLKQYGFPIDDELLADVLSKIDDQAPAVIGLDMYRDLPEPRDRDPQYKTKYPKFEEVLKKRQRIFAITRIGYVDPPPALSEDPERVSANNLLKDVEVDGVYRRGPLICEQGLKEPKASLSFVLTVSYLDHIGVAWGPVPSPGGPDLYQFGKTVIPRLDANAGGYVGLRGLDYEYLVAFEKPLNYRIRNLDLDPLGQAAPKDTPYDYSFGEIIRGDGAFKPGVLKDKIVLVATVMQSIKDSNPTPIYDNLRGVHQHAMMTRQLLDAALYGKAPMTWWPEWGEVLWIAGCTIVGGLLGLWLRSPWKLVPALALLLGGVYFGAWFAFQKGVWILLFWPAFGAVLAAALVTSYVVALERADRRVVQSLFAKHVSKKVADALFEQREQFIDGGKMAPKAFKGTVLFTDLVGFSTASEKLSAQQVIRWLNAYMEVMANIVEEYDGTVNKYIGDAIMAVFGAPIVHENDPAINADATRAIQCGLRMRKEVSILNANWRENEPDMPSVAMRIGIFTGALVHGSFGSNERMEWTVIGDTVNRANRLEAAGKEIKDQLTPEEKLCSILIGPEIYQRVGHLFETAPVPDMTLKGISERVTVYRVLSERAS
jgi:adenylate cyclase